MPDPKDYSIVRVSDGSEFLDAGIEYVDGDVDATPNGSAIFWFDAANVLRVVSAKKPLPTSVVATSSGGATSHSFVNEVVGVYAVTVKKSPGQIYGLHFFNTNTFPVSLHLYNLATVPSTANTPFYRAIIRPQDNFVAPIPCGLSFSVGVAIRVSGVDGSSLPANSVTGNILYK